MKYVVGFSGGIDSQACARWVLNHFPNEDVILLNSNAGEWEHPLTMAFVKWYSENVHPVVNCSPLVRDMWKTPGFAETKGLNGEARLTFQEMVRIKGRPPSRKAQFCTDILKLRPQLRWIQEHAGLLSDGYERYSGVRRDESESRKNTPFREWDEYFDCWLNHPIADWPKQRCFDYVIEHGEEYNELYKLGFGRVGCAPCINSGKADIVCWADRFPEMIDKVRALEASTGRTFFAPCVPGNATNSIDEVLLWARTDRGGRQFTLLLNQRPACESKYGLCE